MRILVIGGGGREHALTWSLTSGRGDVSVVCAPGNPGIARAGDVPSGRSDAAVGTARHRGTGTGGPDRRRARTAAERRRGGPLCRGRPADRRPDTRGRRARIEQGVREALHGAPSACRPRGFVDCATADEALAVIASGDLGLPARGQGRRAGGGQGRRDCRGPSRRPKPRCARRWSLGGSARAGDRVVLEEFLVGQEASYFVLSDGTSFVRMSSAQDHKRIFDDDRGPNTGGMGAFAPSPLVTPPRSSSASSRRVVEPVLNGMRDEGTRSGGSSTSA